MDAPFDRRKFLAGAGTLALAACGPEQQINENLLITTSAVTTLSILQGLTTETTTQLTVDVKKSQSVAYTLTDVETGRVVEPRSVKPMTYASHDTRVDKVKFAGLELGHKYNFVVKDTKTNKVLDDRFLSTVDLNKKNARIAIMSCMNDGKSAKDKIWPSAEAADLDYLFFIGDAVYGDFWIFYGPGYLWGRYVESRKNIPYYHWKNLKPVIAVWDDHDFGKNNEDGTYKFKDHSYQTFKAFFAQEPEGQTLMLGWANSTYFQAFGQNFVFFDNRYYRGLPNPDGDAGFLGHQQIDWMSEVVAARPKPTWIMQGSPVFGRVQKKGSYSFTAPKELDYLMSKVRSWGMPAFFAGGDVHYSEISSLDKSKLGYESFELISSCMHSNTKSKAYDNPNPHMAGYLDENFIVLQKSGAANDPVWKVECIGTNSKLAFKGEFKVG